LLSNAEHIRITREPQAVKTCITRPGEVWDGRWRLTGPENVEQQAEIRALGEAGLAQCPDWRSTARPAAALYGSPAVWIGETLLAAPLAGLSQGWGAELIPRPRRDFAAALSD
jgi:tRNA(Ile)-lysidine synthase